MKLLTVLRRNTPDASGVLKRFPVAIATLAILAGMLIVRSGAPYTPSSAYWISGWSAAALSAIVLALWSEARVHRPSWPIQLLALPVGAAVAALYSTPWISALWLHVALFGAIFLAPASGKTEQQLWTFDTRLVAMAGFAGLAAGIVVLGLILIIVAAEYLFGLRISRHSGSIAIFGFVFLMPTYWLALAPRHDVEPTAPRDLLTKGDLLTKAAASLGALIAAVTGLMAALLYVYAAKIAWAGELPKNQVGWIVSSTLTAGLCGWLLCAGEDGPVAGFRRQFRRWWFPLTAVPAILLAAAIHERIGAYGVTLERYAVAAAAAASFGFIALALFRRGTPSIRGVLAVSILVATVAAVGPFNMPGVVADSQIARLKEKLAAKDLLKDGRVEAKLPGGTWDVEGAKDIITITDEIYKVGAKHRLKGVLPDEALTSNYRTKKFLAVDYSARRAPSSPVYETVYRTGAIEIGAGVFVGQFSFNRPSGPGQIGSQRIDGRLVRLEERRLVIVEGDRETQFDLAPLDVAFDKQARTPLSIASSDGRSTLIVNSARLKKTGGAIVVEQISGSAVIAKL